MTRLTKGQRDFLKAIRDGAHKQFHIRVVQPLYDANLVHPREGNFTFFIVGCNGHWALNFDLLQEGREAVS